MKRDEFFHFVLIPFIIGILGGFSAILFRKLINFFEFLYSEINMFSDDRLYLLTMPFLFWFSYFLISKLLINTSNVTLDNIAKKISIMSGNFSLLKGFLVLFLTSLNIGFGVPVGREAPIAKLGGLFGEVLLKFINVLKVNIPIYLGAAVSSSIAATFNAPLAGIILGLEIIIGRINTYIIIPMIVSCATATMMAREYLGDYTAFFVPHLEFKSIYFYLVPLEGLFFGVMAVLLFYFLNFFREIRVGFRKKWLKIVIFNGFVVGLLIYLVPQSRGVGYEYVTALFKDGFTVHQVFIIMVVKFLAVVITLGSGLFGGLMSPSIFIGAFGGYFLGDVFIHLGVDPKVLALVGSVAMLSAVSRAPLRSSVIIIELTHSYQLLIPSLIIGSISSFIVSKFEVGGYFKRSLIQKGIDIENPNVIKFLKILKISKYLKNIPSLKEETSLQKAKRIFKKYHIKNIAVTNEKNYFKGVVSVKDLRRKYFRIKKLKVKDLVNSKVIYLKEDAEVEEIVKILGLLNSSEVPFVSKDGKYLGMVDIKAIVRDLSLVDRYKII